MDNPLHRRAWRVSTALPLNLLAVVLLVVAMGWLLSTLAAIINFGLRYPAFDQFHFYPTYLALPFPDSAFQLENGHRTFFPTLVKLAEIGWFQAGQTFQLFVGSISMLVTLGVIAIACWRDRISTLQVAVAVLIAVLAITWLGNARMLVHGNELLHVHFVSAFAALSLYCAHAAKGARPIFWMAVAGFLSLCATFSFGTGIASFATTLLMAIVLRVPLRGLAMLALMLAGSVALYLAGMPGDEGVRNSLSFQPLASVATGLRWLASPWIHAWFGLADPPFLPWLQRSAAETTIGSALIGSARAAAAVFGVDWMAREGLLIGTIGAVGWLGCLVHAWRKRGTLSRAQFVSLGLATFGMAAGAIICLARLQHFETSPNDILAERYLPWSCLFWMGLAVYPIVSWRNPSWLAHALSAAIALTAALILFPSHSTWAIWSAVVHRNVQQSAVAAQLGIWDADRFPDGPDASRDDVLRSLDLLKERRLSMYAEPAFEMWVAGNPVPAIEHLEVIDAPPRTTRSFVDTISGKNVVVFEGALPADIACAGDAGLIVVDRAGMLRGLAKFSFAGYDSRALRLTISCNRGFDGYVLDASPGEQLTIVLVRAGDRTAAARIVLQIPADVPAGDEKIAPQRTTTHDED